MISVTQFRDKILFSPIVWVMACKEHVKEEERQRKREMGFPEKPCNATDVPNSSGVWTRNDDKVARVRTQSRRRRPSVPQKSKNWIENQI